MRKPILFVDFDDFLFDTKEHHVLYINKTYGIQSRLSDYLNNPSLDTVIKKYLPADQHHLIDDGAVYVDIGINFNASIEAHKDVKPVEGMCRVIPLLAEKYEIWNVTARQNNCHPVIQHMHDRFIPGCITGIHCVWTHVGNNKFVDVSKREFIMKFKGEKIAFLDDSAKEIERTQDIIPSYLFDPRGENDHQTNIKHRVRSWDHIAEIFL